MCRNSQPFQSTVLFLCPGEPRDAHSRGSGLGAMSPWFCGASRFRLRPQLMPRRLSTLCLRLPWVAVAHVIAVNVLLLARAGCGCPCCRRGCLVPAWRERWSPLTTSTTPLRPFAGPCAFPSLARCSQPHPAAAAMSPAACIYLSAILRCRPAQGCVVVASRVLCAAGCLLGLCPVPTAPYLTSP